MRNVLSIAELESEHTELLPVRETLFFGNNNWAAIYASNSSLALNAAHIGLPPGVQFVLLSDTLIVIPTVPWVVAVVLFITTVVTLISIVPSFIAARLKPVTAMQHAG